MGHLHGLYLLLQGRNLVSASARWQCRPDQVTIEPTARDCRAATLKLVHGTKPGPGCFTDGFGLGEGLVAVATEVLVRASPHRTARILLPGGSGWGYFGAAPHLCSHTGTHGQYALRWGVYVLQADLVQLVQRLEPCSLGAIAGTPARDGGSVLTCTYKGRACSAHDEQKEQAGGAHREAVCGHPTWRGRAAASWKRAHRAVSLKRE